MSRLPSPRLLSVIAGALMVAAALRFGLGPSAAETARVIAPPAQDESVGGDSTATIVLAGGCFWGVQGVYQHVQGVLSAVSGYAGGAREAASYDKVTSGRTGHAEAVRIVYDPRRVTLGQLLQIYFSVAHDPTQLNRQGPDVGTQYRSTIFPATDRQAAIAKAYIDQLNQAKAFPARVVTTIEPGRTFYPAEAYHQDYMTLHPRRPYIAIHDIPKVENLQRLFPASWRADPVLVSKTGM